jgi:hypothetical protein
MTMDRPDDTSKPASGNNQHAAAAPSTALPTHLQQRINTQRAQLLQAHSVLRCLHTVLLHAECDDAVFYADTTSVVANLINTTAEELDSVHLR